MDSASKLIHAFVTSRLDNLNSLLVELPDYVLNKLQLVQNNAARLVAREKEIKPCYTTVKTTPLASNRVSY